jgi:hypothetical protein
LQEKIRRISKIKTISTKDIPEGRGPVGTAIREETYMLFVMTLKTIILMTPWKEEAKPRFQFINVITY